MHPSLQWPRQNINQGLHSQNTPHTSPSRASYGLSIVSIFQKTGPRLNIQKDVFP